MEMKQRLKESGSYTTSPVTASAGATSPTATVTLSAALRPVHWIAWACAIVLVAPMLGSGRALAAIGSWAYDRDALAAGAMLAAMTALGVLAWKREQRRDAARARLVDLLSGCLAMAGSEAHETQRALAATSNADAAVERATQSPEAHGCIGDTDAPDRSRTKGLIADATPSSLMLATAFSTARSPS